MLLKYRRFLLVIGPLFWLQACAVTSPDGQRLRLRSEAFADYVETVFRRQNALASDLAIELGDSDPDSPRYRRLEQAELDLHAACRGLNELALQRRAGEDPRGVGALKRARQAPDCERAMASIAGFF